MEISKCEFEGIDAIRVRNPDIEIVVVTQFGPRIASLCRPRGDHGAPGKNLLFWDSEGKQYRCGWHLRGGHRVWTTRPGADETEEAYAEDNAECSIFKSETGVKILGGTDQKFGIQRGIAIEDSGHDNCLDIVNFATNRSDMLWSGGIWGITCTDRKGKTYAIPLGSGDPDDPWDGFQVYTPKHWAGHGSRVNDPQLKVTENLLIIDPRGVESKRELQAAQGWIGCCAPDDGCSFFKLMGYDPARAGLYPNMCNAAYYIGPDNFMVEMELMGPQQTVMPGQTIELRERWVIAGIVYWDSDFPRIQDVLNPYFEGLPDIRNQGRVKVLHV